jgi:hypothetical protein
MNTPPIVSAREWQAAWEQLLVKACSGRPRTPGSKKAR